ncbi:MAG: NAD(P)/FAD-dependent oxidoreductase [Candidatus Methylomirabilales bacterium]
MSQPRAVTVIGAGIVGICCASYLQRDGHAVTVIDSRPPGEGCSQGNAGHISPGACVPLAMPGILWQVPRWLIDPLGPLCIRWGYLPRVAPWLLRFAKAATPEQAEATSIALRALHATTFEAYDPLIKSAGAEDLISRSGPLYLFESQQTFAHDRAGWALRRARGVKMEELDAVAIRQLEPALAPIYQRAIFLPDQGFCHNPLRLVQALAKQFTREGGRLLRRTVTGFEIGPEGPRRLHTDAGDIEVQDVVICAGAWSHRLTAHLGDRVPLESERRYHLELPSPGVTLSRSVVSVDRKFVATPMETGLRFTGTVEFAGLSAPPDPRRARILLDEGRRMFPGLKAKGASEWMGHRPSLPDSKPVIDRSPRFPSVYYAFGHGHTGMTGASVTGRLIAALVAGRPPEIDLSPFRVTRF